MKNATHASDAIVLTGQGTYQRAWPRNAGRRTPNVSPPAPAAGHNPSAAPNYGGICIECSDPTAETCPACGHFAHAGCRELGCWGCRVMADLRGTISPDEDDDEGDPPPPELARPLRVSQGGVLVAFLCGFVCCLLCAAMAWLEFRRGL